MDSLGFRILTQPALYSSVASATPVQPRPDASRPGSDNRYDFETGKMEDARGVTDYRPQCEENIPAGSQFATKHWLQNNGEAIMKKSRSIQIQRTGAYYGARMDLEPRAAQEVVCTPYGCKAVSGAYDTGIGMERLEGCPHLFGTFDPAPGANGPPLTAAVLTTKFEGGRNSSRGGSVRNTVGVNDRLPWEGKGY
jgi:hypothetical protein